MLGKCLSFLFPLSRGAIIEHLQALQAWIDSPPSRNTGLEIPWLQLLVQPTEGSITKPKARTRLQHRWQTGEGPTQHLHISSLQILSWPHILEGGTGKSRAYKFLQRSFADVCPCGYSCHPIEQPQRSYCCTLTLQYNFVNQHVCKSSGYLTEVALNCRLEITLSVNLSYVCRRAEKRLVQEEIGHHEAVLLLVQKEENLSFYHCKTSFEATQQSHWSHIQNANSRTVECQVCLTCILIVCTLSARAFQDLPPVHLCRIRDLQIRREVLPSFRCLVSREDPQETCGLGS